MIFNPQTINLLCICAFPTVFIVQFSDFMELKTKKTANVFFSSISVMVKVMLTSNQ